MGYGCASIELVSILILSGVLFFETIQLGFCSKADVNTRCMEIERNALLKLKEGLTDPSDQLSSWVADESDCCKWRGVGCNNITGHVVSLNLRNPYDSFRYSYGNGWFYDPDVTLHALGGEINPSLLVLTDLVYLDLSMNDYGGLQLPSFIGSLEKLKYLNLSWSSFGGVFPPNLGNLSRLVYLDLKGNNFVENDLRWLPGLSSLKYLNLGLANLTMAAPYWLPIVNMLPLLTELHFPSCDLSVLPATLPYINFTSLSVLNLPSNGFNSTLPPWLFNLTKLVHLDLSYNYLHGALPETFGRLTSLRTLDLSKNSDIGGQLPKALGMLCNLQTLKLFLVGINGEITDFIDGLSGCTNSSLVMLDLESNQLTGNLPSSLGYLRNLRYLQLEANSFQGSIPESIGNLTSLEEFYLSRNQMLGVIPESLGQLSSLVVLDISVNSWEGVITEAHLVNLRSLKEVTITKDSSNISLVFNISSDWIPPFKLRYLNLKSCQLGPKFPTWLRNQNELVTLVINNARISDIVPDWFWQLDFLLEELDVSSNQLRGRVPNTLRFSYPATLDLSSNRFDGPLSLWSSNITNLFLRDNLFSGPIPRNFGPVMSKLWILDISSNSLTGNIPSSFGNLSLLLTVSLSNNYLSGEIPNCWDSKEDLYIVDMSNNSLSGRIPTSLGSLPSLNNLILSNNNLSGELPSSLQNCTRMYAIDFGDNRLSGNIPAWIGESMSLLLILRLTSNSFTGNIPSQLCGLSSLHILDLSHNNLSGGIPHCVGNLSRLKSEEKNALFSDGIYTQRGATMQLEVVSKGRVLYYGSILYLVNSLDLSNNSLTGEMPEELTSLIKLATLNLSSNHLTGTIPATIGNLVKIETLDLSTNKLSGSIPPSMVSMTFLVHLNLSYNKLSGTIPTSNQFNTFVDPSIYKGNAALCGYPLPNGCRDTEKTPQVPSEDGQDGDDSELEKLWLIISMVIGFIVGFWGVCGSLVINKSWRHAYFNFLDKVKYALIDFVSAIGKHLQKRSRGTEEF